MFHVGLDLSVRKLATDEALGIEDGVDGVHGDLVLGAVSDETLGVGERDKGRGCAVSLVIGDLWKSVWLSCDLTMEVTYDLNAVITVDTHAAVRGTKINTCAMLATVICVAGCNVGLPIAGAILIAWMR